MGARVAGAVPPGAEAAAGTVAAAAVTAEDGGAGERGTAGDGGTPGRCPPGAVPGLTEPGAATDLGALAGGETGGRGTAVRGASTISLVDLLTTRR